MLNTTDAWRVIDGVDDGVEDDVEWPEWIHGAFADSNAGVAELSWDSHESYNKLMNASFGGTCAC